MEEEIWKDITGFNGYYSISNYGNVKRNFRITERSDKRRIKLKEKMLRSAYNERGYLHIRLIKDNERKTYRINRLVAMEFVPNPNNYKEVNHIDGVKDNNYYKNLEWCTRSQNIQHAFKNGLLRTNKKVVQLDLEGNVIKFWDSMGQACKELGAKRPNITKCCKNRNRKTKGYKWMFKEDYDKEMNNER